MCYEFVHSCSDSLKDRLASLLTVDTYCLICIGDINYIYCSSGRTAACMKTFLEREKVRCYALSAEEMISVIDFPGMEAHQSLSGSKLLLDQLRERCGMLQ